MQPGNWAKYPRSLQLQIGPGRVQDAVQLPDTLCTTHLGILTGAQLHSALAAYLNDVFHNASLLSFF